MPEEVNGAEDLAEKLTEFDNPLGGDGGGFGDIMDAIDGIATDDDTEQPDATPEPKAEKTKVEPEEAAETEEADAEEEEEWDPLADDGEKKDSEEEAEQEEEPEPEEVPKTSKDWEKFKQSKAELRRQYKEAEKEKANLQQELTKLREEAADLAELREQKEIFEEAQKELAVSRVEGTVEYKQTIAAPLKGIEEQVVAIAKANETSADKLFDAILEADPVARRKLLKEATEDMDSVDQSDVFQMARDAQELMAKRDAIRANAHEAAKEAREHAEAREAAAAKKAQEEYVANATHAISELKKRTPFKALKEGETEANVYAALEKKAKETDFSKLTGDKQALAVAALLHSPRLLSQLQKAQEEISKLESRLSRKNAGKPKVGGSTKDAPADGFEGDVEAAVDDFFGLQHSQDITQKLSGLIK